MRLRSLFALLTVAAATFATGAVQSQTVHFAGYDWRVSSGANLGPGPNNWSASNVWVDSAGALHLKISHGSSGKWYCAEVETTQRLGFGSYQFQVIGRIDELDPNVVLGLFDYPTPDVGPDTTNEIDIEFAHWGNPTYPIGNYTVWPAQFGVKQTSYTFNFKLNGTYTTQRFTRTANSILFQSLHGHVDDNTNEYARWLFQPTNAQSTIPQQPLPVHINLWLFQGKPPTNGRGVQIVISSFKFTPQ